MDIKKFERIDWVDNNIAISGYIVDYNKLVEENIDIVINTRVEDNDDISILSKKNIAYYWIPCLDNLAPRFDQFDTFNRIVNKNKDRKILIHCDNGRGRSASFVISYLINKYNLTLDKAIEKLKEIRPIVSLTEFQVNKLYKLYGE